MCIRCRFPRFLWCSASSDKATRKQWLYYLICGIALPKSGERDNYINIEGITEYTISQSYDAEDVMFYDSSDDELDMVVGSDGGDV